MKKTSVAILLLSFLTLVGYSQKIKKLDSITFEKLEEINQSKKYKNNVELKNYRTSTGNWLSIGDTLIIGKPNNENKLEQNAMINGSTNNHTYIFLGSNAAALMGSVMMANENMTDTEAKIVGFRMGRISRRQPFGILVELNKADGIRFLGLKKLARADLEKALASKELIDPNAPMTREEAISKLKEAKELLDLEMMTQEKYDKIKKKLAPIIRGK